MVRPSKPIRVKQVRNELQLIENGQYVTSIPLPKLLTIYQVTKRFGITEVLVALHYLNKQRENNGYGSNHLTNTNDDKKTRVTSPEKATNEKT